MEFQSVQHTIDKLVQWIRSGRLALPDFQRDFVWNPGRVVELLDSVARQWPIGSLLLLSGPQPFGIRAIADAPPLKGSSLDFYVLDGQQRLTSLYHAISDVSEFCYFVDFSALIRDEDEYIRWEKRKGFEKKYPTLNIRASNSIALIKDIWELDSFYAWVESVADQGLQRQYVSLRDKRLGGLQARVYKLMAIELDQEIQLEALARIFETLNRTGVRLNAFDLMVAMLYPTGFHLRDKWEEAKLTFDVLDQYNVDPIEVLKLAALLIRGNVGRKASKGVRQGDLLELDRELLRNTWETSVKLYSDTLNFARERLGIFCADAVPAWSMILGLGSWLSLLDVDEDAIQYWFWGSAFSQTYSQAANTVVVADFDLINSEQHETLVDKRINDPFLVLEEPARKNGLALRSMACYFAKIGALDPVSGAPLSDSPTLAFRALDKNGKLQKFSDNEPFSRVVFMSKNSDKLLSKASAIPGYSDADPGEIHGRLVTQLIHIDKMERDVDEFRSLVRDGYIWESL